MAMSGANMRATATAIVATILLSGCGGGQSVESRVSTTPTPKIASAVGDPGNARPTSRPFDHESDVEYQNGLAKVLEWSPALNGPKLITAVYTGGYQLGLLEAEDYQSFVDGMVSGLGCSYGFAALRGIASRADDLCPNSRAEARPQGRLYSKGRLLNAQLSAKTFQDSRQIEIIGAVYRIGYNMGFAHRWEAVDQATRVERLVKDRCMQVVQKHEAALSATESGDALSKCEVGAKESKAEFGGRFRCLLVGPRGDSDLSGLTTKPGCPNSPVRPAMP